MCSQNQNFTAAGAAESNVEWSGRAGSVSEPSPECCSSAKFSDQFKLLLKRGIYRKIDLKFYYPSSSFKNLEKI